MSLKALSHRTGQLQPCHRHPRDMVPTQQRQPTGTTRCPTASQNQWTFLSPNFLNTFLPTEKLPHHPYFGEFSFLAPSFRQAHLSYSRLALQAGCKSLYQPSWHVFNNLFTVAGGEKRLDYMGGETKKEYNFRELHRTFHKYVQWWREAPLSHCRAEPGAGVKITLVVFDAPCAQEGIAAPEQEREKGKSVCWKKKTKKMEKRKKGFVCQTELYYCLQMPRRAKLSEDMSSPWSSCQLFS